MESRAKSPIDENRAAQYLTELAVPRMAGTEMDRRTADRIEEHLRSLGLVVERERFEFGSKNIWIRKTLITLLPVSLFVSLFLLHFAPLFSFLCSVGVLIMFSYMTRNISKVAWLGHEWGKKTQTQNIVATKRPELEERAHLILGAHYDSLSLTRSIYPNSYVLMLVFLPVFFVSLGLLAVIGTVGLISTATGFILPPVAVKVFLWLSIVLSLLFITYLVTGHGNRSAGASDNASGVAVLMELANALVHQPLRYLRLSFAAFGAEEMGLLGSNHYFLNRRHAWSPDRTYVISVDMPAGKGKFGYNPRYGIPPRRTNKYLNGLIREAARQVGVKCEEVGLAPGSGSDHMPFLERGVPGALIGTLSKESIKAVHTPQDDLNAIDYNHLRDACQMLHRLILNMDESLV